MHACMYIYIYIYRSICLYIWIHTPTHTHTHTHTHTKRRVLLHTRFPISLLFIHWQMRKINMLFLAGHSLTLYYPSISVYIWYDDLWKHEAITVASNQSVIQSIVQRFVYPSLGTENIRDINSTWSHNALIMAITVVLSGCKSWLLL